MALLVGVTPGLVTGVVMRVPPGLIPGVVGVTPLSVPPGLIVGVVGATPLSVPPGLIVGVVPGVVGVTPLSVPPGLIVGVVGVTPLSVPPGLIVGVVGLVRGGVVGVSVNPGVGGAPAGLVPGPPGPSAGEVDELVEEGCIEEGWVEEGCIEEGCIELLSLLLHPARVIEAHKIQRQPKRVDNHLAIKALD